VANPHYHENLSFLLEGGRAMAEAHPRSADMLAKTGLDPDVERLLEGVAYLSGKINEKLTESLPELCQFLFDLLFPNYLCPVPSSAIVEFMPTASVGTVPAGAEVRSVPVRGTECRFRTTYGIDHGPWTIETATWSRTRSGAELLLRVGNAVTPGEPFPPPEEDRLRLYLRGEPQLTASLYQWILTRCLRIELVDDNGTALPGQTPITVHPIGFSEEECLLPYPEGTFAGFRLLQEYFTLPQKFLFLDVEGVWAALAAAWGGELTPRFGLKFHLKVETQRNILLAANNFRLGCTPVINLFEHSGDPVERNPRFAELKLRPAGADRHYEIFRVLEVQGASRSGTIQYPLLSELDPGKGSAFALVIRRRFGEEYKFYLSLVDDPDSSGHARDPLLADQVVITDLLCSNGALPRALRVGDISIVSAPHEALACRSISAVTAGSPVPMGEELRRRLIVHLSLTQLDLATKQAIHDAIDLYNLQVLVNPQVAREHSLLLEGIVEVRSTEIQHRVGETFVWGRAIELELDESAFSSEGELYLFGCILNELIALQSPLNLFSEFSIRFAKSKRALRWPKRLGRILLG
jgi:type VI secretion system protein ImpG